jgi:hypothetical protein
MTATEPTGRELTHGEWYRRFAHPAAQTIWRGVRRLARHLEPGERRFVLPYYLEIVVSLIGPKESWPRPSDAVVFALRFDATRFDFASRGLAPPLVALLAKAQAVARRKAP